MLYISTFVLYALALMYLTVLVGIPTLFIVGISRVVTGGVVEDINRATEAIVTGQHILATHCKVSVWC